MMPISVDGMHAAFAAGADRARNAQQDFRQGVQGLGKSAGDAILGYRLRKEDAEELEAKRLQSAIDGGDTEALERMVNTGLWAKPERPGNGTASALWAMAPEAQAQVQARKDEALAGKARARIEELNNRPSARRAAERAGMATGYIPASEQDKMDFAANEKMKQMEMEMEKFNLQQADNQADIASKSYDFNNRQEAYEQNRITQIRQAAQGRELRDDEKQEIREAKARAVQYRQAAMKDREWLTARLKEGDPRLNFGDRPDVPAINDDLMGFTDKYFDAYEGLDKSFLSNFETLTTPTLDKVASQLGITDAGEKQILKQYLESDLNEHIAKREAQKRAELHKLGIAEANLGIKGKGISNEQSAYNLKLSQFNSDYPNYSAFTIQDAQNRATSAKAVDLFKSGDYRATIEALKATMPESDSIGLKLPFVNLSFSDNPTREDAIRALKSFNESMKIIENELSKANARKKELGL